MHKVTELIIERAKIWTVLLQNLNFYYIILSTPTYPIFSQSAGPQCSFWVFISTPENEIQFVLSAYMITNFKLVDYINKGSSTKSNSIESF